MFWDVDEDLLNLDAFRMDSQVQNPNKLSCHQLIWSHDKLTSNCSHCNNIIIGLIKPGVKCTQCNKVFHRDCINNIGLCESVENGLPMTDSEHNFDLQQFYKPTDCDVCKSLIYGIFKQGLQCTKCLYIVHERCRDKVIQPCIRAPSNMDPMKPTVSLPPQSQSKPEDYEFKRRSAVTRMFEHNVTRRSKTGDPLILKEEYLIFSKVQDEATSKMERKFWRLTSKSIELYSAMPCGEGVMPELEIILSDITSIEGLTKSKFNFVMRTKTYSDFFVVVPSLQRYTLEFGINLMSTWETHIKEAVTAFIRDNQNQLLDVSNSSDILRSRSPSVSTSGSSVASKLKYNILSDIKLGEGQFGVVYEGLIYDEKDKSKPAVPVAVKIIDKSRFSLPADKLYTLQNEVSILQQLNHHGIVRMLHVYENNLVICVFMEKMCEDLLEYILSRPTKILSERQTKLFSYQILSAIKYLNSRDVAHCDLKPENILMVSSIPDQEKYYDPNDPSFYPYQVKLCDFGFSRIIGDRSFRNSLVGTPAYLAPEVMSSQGYDKSLDMWSVGVCLYVCLTSCFPFDSYSDIVETAKSIWKLFPISMWYNYSFSCINIINQLLQMEPKTRLTVDKALEHIWFQSENFHRDLVALERATGLTGHWLAMD